MSIKEYLILIEIRDYLLKKYNDELEENNGNWNNPITELQNLIGKLNGIIDKLEKGGE